MQVIKDNDGVFIVTGWFPIEKNNDNLKISFLVLKDQVEKVKKLHKNVIWIIIMRKKNKFVYNINKKMGFNKASYLSIKRALKYFSTNENEVDIMEMIL